MFSNYFKIAWRNLMRNKAFAVTNLLGLTIGITCTILILLWVQNELSWDDFQPNYHTTYQLMANRNFNGQTNTDEALMLPLAKNLETRFPQVKYAAFTSHGSESHLLSVGDKKLKQNALRVSDHYFHIFPWTFVKGNAVSAMSTPDALVLTQKAATALFGSEDAMGKMVKLDNDFDVKVTGIIKDVPEAFTMQFDCITPFNYDLKAMDDWQNCYVNLFIQTTGTINKEALDKSITGLINKNTPDLHAQFFLNPMSRWHLYSDFKDGINVGGMVEYVKLFTIIAVIILLIACVNFMNLSTARSERRAKEVGIRKTLGSAKTQLMLQFFASFTIEKRFREIGVRKVLGASVQQLLLLISKEFLKLVSIAFLIAVPVTWWAMSVWLQHYDYRITLSLWLFAIVGVLVLLLTLVIVSVNTLKAAVTNPVKSLRTE